MIFVINFFYAYFLSVCLVLNVYNAANFQGQVLVVQELKSKKQLHYANCTYKHENFSKVSSNTTDNNLLSSIPIKCIQLQNFDKIKMAAATLHFYTISGSISDKSKIPKILSTYVEL